MLHGVLDPQPDRLAFSLFKEGKTLLATEKIMRGRDAASLPGFLEEELQKISLHPEDVARWTIGSGPGSFTFLRIVAALAAGWKYGRDSVRFRCIPGAVALAAALKPAPQETVGALYDGRNHEILYFAVRNCDGVLEPAGETAVLNAAEAKTFFTEKHPGERLICFPCEKEAISAILPQGTAWEALPADLTALAASPAPFDDDLDRLVYIRPAVFPPKEA